jgi:hypothetical protein
MVWIDIVELACLFILLGLLNSHNRAPHGLVLWQGLESHT